YNIDESFIQRNSVISWYYRQFCFVTEYGKVEILLKAVGDAPILKQNKWMVDESKTVAELTIFLRNYMKLSDSDSLLLFINQSFAPSPDQTLQNLKDCFASGDSKLIINYSKTPAWG
ncbi:unnamed protein product, partial [Thelazia callipaeda]|uniref:Ubiquitin-like protein ATG12 n=1 Tax=Thelazia callipaeda TaxID=103827 RepID=A0A0N5D4C8_THECL